MRLRMNPERERRFDELCDALEETTKSKAIDRAAELTIALLGVSTTIKVRSTNSLNR